MMETIRKAANHIVVKIIFAIIILCFIFTGIGFLGFGGGSNKNDEVNYIAKVDGEGISRSQFEAVAKEITSNTVGDNALLKTMRRNVLFYQIDNYLAYKFSQTLKTVISNERVKDIIRQDRKFFDNGKFSDQKYKDLLVANGLDPDFYVEVFRSSLQQQQVMAALVNTDFALPVDSELSLLKDQTRKVYLASIDPTIVNMDDVQITTEDEKKYYDEHHNEFYRKERVKFKYIYQPKYTLLKTINVSDEEIKQDYDKNISTYLFPAKHAYSIIYVTDKQQADDIAKDLSSGGDFDNIVKTVNQNNEISPYGKNGSLGWFAVDDTLPQAFKDADLKKIGQISKPIAVEGGFLIVKLDDVQKAKSMDFDYVKYQIGQKLINKKQQDAFEAIEDKIKAALIKYPESLEDIAKEANLNLYTSDWAYYDDKISVLRYPEVRDVAFSDEMLKDGQVTGKISDIISGSKDQDMFDIVMQVVDYHPEGIASFDEVKDEIDKKIKSTIASSRFKSTVDNILTELNNKGESDQVLFNKNYVLSRTSNDLDKKIVDMVFNIVPSTTSKRVYGVESLRDLNADIAVLIDVNTPNEVKDISTELKPLFIKNGRLALTADIRSRAKIEIMPNSNL